MLPNDVNTRADRVMSFINAKSNELNAIKARDAHDNNPQIKMNCLNREYQNAPSDCIDTVLGRMYKNALPFDDPNRYGSDEEARSAIHDYIARRTDGKNSEWYVREALKRNPGNKTLQGVLNEARESAKKFYQEKSKNIGEIKLQDINYNKYLQEDDVNRITMKLELDEISQIIHNNVQNALQAEIDKARAEEEYHQQIEDQLASDPNVVDDASMESAMQKIRFDNTPKVYQPSLMEAILVGKAQAMQESTQDEVMNESIREYTMLSMSKALKLESFDMYTTKKLANSYL